MLQIGVCDDQEEARSSLRFSLEAQLEEAPGGYNVFEFSSGEGLLGWMKRHQGEMDLVFLDIELRQINGMEVARRLRDADPGLQIVFVTGHPDYVYDGYAVGALGYLLKPPRPQQVRDVLRRAQAALCRDAEQVFICHNGETSYRIQRRDILYFTSDKRLVRCVAAQRDYVFYGKLDQVEQSLNDDGFVRIHQRYLVRAAGIQQVDGSQARLFNGETLPISRSCRAAALLALTRAMLK